MLYSSTRGIDKNRCFKEVLLKGLAEDGGLYVPKKLKVYNY
jgi:Threonine synthase